MLVTHAHMHIDRFGAYRRVGVKVKIPLALPIAPLSDMHDFTFEADDIMM